MSSRGRTAGRVLVLLVAALGAALAGLSYPIASKGTGWLTATWEHPWLLGALGLVPVVLYRTTFGEDARLPRLRLGTILPLTKGPAGQRVWLRDIPGVLRAVALGFLIAATARPVSTIQPDTAEEEGIDVVLVLDLSGSMEAVLENLPPDLAQLAPPKQRGLRPTRLDGAKAVIRDF